MPRGSEPRETQAKINKYIDGPWSAWSAKEKAIRATKVMYEKLFSLQKSIEAGTLSKPPMGRWPPALEKFEHWFSSSSAYRDPGRNSHKSRDCIIYQSVAGERKFANGFANEPRSTAWHGAPQAGIIACQAS
jgi:hypothetical protein